MKTLGKTWRKVGKKHPLFNLSSLFSKSYPLLSIVFNTYSQGKGSFLPHTYNVYFSFPLFHKSNNIFKYVYTN